MDLKTGIGDVTPMMMVPVFIVLITFFAFMAVRNEQIKDDTRELRAQIEEVNRNIARESEETARKIESASSGIDRLDSSRNRLLSQVRRDTRELIDAQGDFVKRASLAKVDVDRRQEEIDELHARIDSLQEQLTTLRTERWRRGQRQPDAEPEPDPVLELFGQAEAESALVLRKYQLAVTSVDIYPVLQVVVAKTYRMVDSVQLFTNQVNAYYGRFTGLEQGNFDQRYALYLDLRDQHGDLRDERTRLLKSMKAAIDELTEIERNTNRVATKSGFDRSYVSVYIPLIEGQRTALRDVDCKPPAEPHRRIQVR